MGHVIRDKVSVRFNKLHRTLVSLTCGLHNPDTQVTVYMIRKFKMLWFPNEASKLLSCKTTSRHFTPHGRYKLNKLTSLPKCGFIAQLVEYRTGIRGGPVMGSNPVEALIFSGFFFPVA